MNEPKLVGAALAPLVYWLLVVCGLAGITVLRFGSFGSFVTADDVFALWAGSVLGVAIGQGASAARIRAWVPLVVTMFGFWFLLPILALVIDGIFGATAQTFVLAFLPASICGYLSLTERGALVSFWYPAVLWMIVILDGPTPGVFDERFALPFVVGLAALFVVYLRARETRRVAIWKAHANDRLADPLPRTVLRTSPLRAASQHLFSAMAGACALVLTAWIAPHLWQTVNDPARVAASARAHASETAAPHDGSAVKPCCPAFAKRREKVKEYFGLQNGKELDDDLDVTGQCRVCPYEGSGIASSSSSYSGPWSYGGIPGSGLGGGGGSVTIDDSPYGTGSGTYGYGSGTPNPNGGYDPYAVTSTPASVPLAATTSPEPIAPMATKPAEPKPAAKPDAKPSAPVAATEPTITKSPANEPAAIAPAPAPAAAGGTIALPAPWKSSLGLCTIAFAFILFTRATRRALTLRHLVRPFWNETLDQRISNHWQRALIGLRDAGLAPSDDEQPGAFARRIGIEGLETCATILERVRHGVRVDSDDLVNMAVAAEHVYRSARIRAGFAGRATAWLRWPMS